MRKRVFTPKNRNAACNCLLTVPHCNYMLADIMSESTYRQSLQSVDLDLKALDLCLFVGDDDFELVHYVAVMLLSRLKTLLGLRHSVRLLR